MPTDQEVKSDIQDTLTWDIRVNNQDIIVDVADGVVTLTGTVDTYDQKLEAAQIAGRIKGVVDIINDIVVKPVSARPDLEIQNDVGMAIRRDVRVNAEDVIVNVNSAVVTLSGSVPTIAQKNAIESDAWLTPGVTDVIDNIVVAPPFARTDHEIKDNVLARLLGNTSIYIRHLNVDVVNGVVYIRGSVSDYTQKWIASDDAWRVPGVKNVVNELAVERVA